MDIQSFKRNNKFTISLLILLCSCGTSHKVMNKESSVASVNKIGAISLSTNSISSKIDSSHIKKGKKKDLTIEESEVTKYDSSGHITSIIKHKKIIDNTIYNSDENIVSHNDSNSIKSINSLSKSDSVGIKDSKSISTNRDTTVANNISFKLIIAILLILFVLGWVILKIKPKWLGI